MSAEGRKAFVDGKRKERAELQTSIRELNLERGHFLAHRCDSSEYVTRQKTQRELVRVLNDGHVVGGQAQGGGSRSHGSHCTRHNVCVHERILSLDVGRTRERTDRRRPW